MPSTFDPLPEIPSEIENAAQSGELVVFVGAGISRLIKCPSWDNFADRVLEQLVPSGIDYYELSQIKGIADPKKRLSIAQIVAKKKGIKVNYSSLFEVSLEPGNVYDHLNSFNSSFVTTNYDKHLKPDSRKHEAEKSWRFYKSEDFLRLKIDQNGNVVHIHGCIDDPESMVITAKDYLRQYSGKELQEFLEYLFNTKTILFLGYGLDEIEVLEYIFRKGANSNITEGKGIRRFILQGYFNAEMNLFDLLQEYYMDSFATMLIGFPKDHKEYYQLLDILALWAKKLRFGSVALVDEVAALEDEISG